ncbi:AlbA family DNA-binding domain-containing protein [Streptomyces microflavus]|uniref:AlbA family DNA-binding domain-containing protein n=1 Tax=Streptomyces microflavus TaxID=1919 RepID=UPI003667415C
MAFRSRRLEALLGGRVDQLTYDQVAELVNVGEAAEAEDLDYKRELTASDPKGKEELAKDVCSFANHIGGVLISASPKHGVSPRRSWNSTSWTRTPGFGTWPR